jgi:hypothetical protein
VTSRGLAIAFGGLLVTSGVACGVLLLRRWAAGRTTSRGHTPRPSELDDRTEFDAWAESNSGPPAPSGTNAYDNPYDIPYEQYDPYDLEEGDFASEHSRATFAFEQPGGPEGVAEPESPRGLAGMDDPRSLADRFRRRRGSR